jgi:hypothetical protein
MSMKDIRIIIEDNVGISSLWRSCICGLLTILFGVASLGFCIIDLGCMLRSKSGLIFV